MTKAGGFNLSVALLGQCVCVWCVCVFPCWLGSFHATPWPRAKYSLEKLCWHWQALVDIIRRKKESWSSFLYTWTPTMHFSLAKPMTWRSQKQPSHLIYIKWSLLYLITEINRVLSLKTCFSPGAFRYKSYRSSLESQTLWAKWIYELLMVIVPGQLDLY